MATTPNIPSSITLSVEDYTALVALARHGTKDQVSLESFLATIEKANDIIRYLLWVQWQELDAPLPPGTRFPEVWPPNLRQLIQTINAPISQQDVDNALAQSATNPTNVMVSPDVAGLLGWTPVDTYFSR